MQLVHAAGRGLSPRGQHGQTRIQQPTAQLRQVRVTTRRLDPHLRLRLQDGVGLDATVGVMTSSVAPTTIGTEVGGTRQTTTELVQQ